jgi:hypothetical protein
VVYVWVLTLVFGVSAIRETWKLGAQCNGEAKVSIERNGPNGTFAGDRPDASDTKLAVALTFRGVCWAAGSLNIAGGEGIESQSLPKPAKSLISSGRVSNANNI